MGRVLTQPSRFQFFSARHEPAHQTCTCLGPARPIAFSKVSARPGPAQTNGPWQALIFKKYYFFQAPHFCMYSTTSIFCRHFDKNLMTGPNSPFPIKVKFGVQCTPQWWRQGGYREQIVLLPRCAQFCEFDLKFESCT